MWQREEVKHMNKEFRYVGDFPDGIGGVELAGRYQQETYNGRKGTTISRDAIVMAGDSTAVILEGGSRHNGYEAEYLMHSAQGYDERHKEVVEVVVFEAKPDALARVEMYLNK